MIRVPGVAPMPIPFTTLGYGRGVTDDITVFGSWHPTSSVFGVWQFDAGASFRLWKNDNMGVSVSPVLNGMVDIFDAQFNFYPQLDANYYWEYKNDADKKNDLYIGFDNWLDPKNEQAHGQPNDVRWIWNTHVGHTFTRGNWSYQLEVKIMAPYIDNNVVVDYISPFGDRGGMGFYFGVIRTFGGKK